MYRVIFEKDNFEDFKILKQAQEFAKRFVGAKIIKITI